MNDPQIFFVERKPADAAKCMCDSILIDPDARLLEMVLSPTRHPFVGPLVEWVRKSHANWRWLHEYVWAQELERHWRGLDLITSDYAFRYYGRGEKPENPNSFLPEYENSEFPRSVPEKYHWPENVVEAWRLYYFDTYHQDATWTRRTPPQWFVTF